MNLTLSILCLAVLSFAISFLATLGMKHLAPKIGFVDKPGGRKIHANPKPLGGGVAIYLGIVLPMLAGLAIVLFVRHGFHIDAAYWSGARKQLAMALTLLGVMTAMHILGLIDDRNAMGPYLKLFVQL